MVFTFEADTTVFEKTVHEWAKSCLDLIPHCAFFFFSFDQFFSPENSRHVHICSVLM